MLKVRLLLLSFNEVVRVENADSYVPVATDAQAVGVKWTGPLTFRLFHDDSA